MNLSSVQRHQLSWLLIAVAMASLWWLLAPVLTPFVMAAVLAYALQPAVERGAKHGLPRALSVCLVVVLAIFAVLALFLLVVPILAKELPQMRDQLPAVLARLEHSLSPWLGQWGVTIRWDVASLQALAMRMLDGNVEDWMYAALNSARIGGSIALAVLGHLVLVPVVLFYLLLDWPRLVRGLHHLVPPRVRPPFYAFLTESDAVLGQYLRGQLSVMLILAVYYAAALGLAGFELALPVGVFTGLAIFIPYLGFGFGLILALLAAVLQFSGWYGLGAVALIYGSGQILEGFFLTPRLVGERIGLNPLAVIFALLAFGHLFGLVGVLVALPVSAVLLVAGRRLRSLYLGSELYRE